MSSQAVSEPRRITISFTVPTVRVRWLELAAVCVLLAVALGLRTWNLTDLPSGLHGDEAIAGLEGLRILREGNIGPYSTDAMGQPSGPLYLTAISVALFGNTIFAVRIVPAVMGTLTVLVFYLLLRRNLGIATALMGAALLATMSWHVQFARIGFPIGSWPLVAVLIALALVEALRSDDWRWWAAAGVLTASGIYVYNAHPVFGASVVLYVAGVLAWRWLRRRERPSIAVAAFLLAGAMTLIPMALYALDGRNGYFNHHMTQSVGRTPEWDARPDMAGKLALVAERYVQYWSRICCEPRLDGVDASGVTPVVPMPMLALAAVGAIYGVLFRRSHLLGLALLTILLMPAASVATNGGEARRTLVMAPFVALLAAMALADFWKLRERFPQRLRAVPGLVAAACAALVMYQNLDNYWLKLPASSSESWVFGKQFTEAVEYMSALPEGSQVLFYSERWSVNYEPREFLAPDVAVEDRSLEHNKTAGGSMLADPEKGSPVYILMGKYIDKLPEAKRLYPGGTEQVAGDPEKPSFVAFRANP